MTTDDLLTTLDPTRPDEARFDRDGAAAQRVLAAARAATPARAPRRRPLVLAGAFGTLAATAAAVAVLGGGSLSPAAALAQSADRTATFDSGRVVYRVQDGRTTDVIQELRFSGPELAITQRGHEVLASGAQSSLDLELVIADGGQWMRRPGAGWKSVGPASAGPGIAGPLREQVGNVALVALIKTASDVRQDGSTFHATIDADALRALPTDPFGFDHSTATGTIDMAVTVASDGTIHELTLAVGDLKRTAIYEELGEPQEIAAPDGR